MGLRPRVHLRPLRGEADPRRLAGQGLLEVGPLEQVPAARGVHRLRDGGGPVRRELQAHHDALRGGQVEAPGHRMGQAGAAHRHDELRVLRGRAGPEAAQSEVRATKREIALGEASGADVTAARVRLGELQGKLKAHCAANHLRRDYERERAYGLPAGSQPRALKAIATARKVLGRGAGGAAPGELRPCPGVLVNRRDKEKTAEFVTETLRAIAGYEVEHAVVVQGDGRVFHAVGTEDAVTLDGADLDGAIVMHNHPTTYGEAVSFGKDDYEKLRENPKMTLLTACSGGYRYEMKAGPRIAEVGYDEAEMQLSLADIGKEDLQHLVMRSLDDLKAIRYRRKDL